MRSALPATVNVACLMSAFCVTEVVLLPSKFHDWSFLCGSFLLRDYVCWTNFRHSLSWGYLLKGMVLKVTVIWTLLPQCSLCTLFDLVLTPWKVSIDFTTTNLSCIWAPWEKTVDQLSCPGFGAKKQVQYTVLSIWYKKKKNLPQSPHLFLSFKSLDHQASCWIH